MAIKFKKFTVEQKSTFSYWWWHYIAYNYTAWKLGVWKPKWLLHDIEKPWLKLIWGDYNRVKMWHKHHNSHHVFYGRSHGMNKIDWLAVALDWECSNLTKKQCPRNALEETKYILSGAVKKYTKTEIEEIRKNIFPILKYLGLYS